MLCKFRYVAIAVAVVSSINIKAKSQTVSNTSKLYKKPIAKKSKKSSQVEDVECSESGNVDVVGV
jgi:hypothetical protein